MGKKAQLIGPTPGDRPGRVSPDSKGNRAQRRAWAKLTKSKTPPASDTNTEAPDE